MKKFLSVIILLIISSIITNGQQVSPAPVKFSGIEKNTYQNLDHYFVKNVNQTRAVIWSSNMSSSSGWTVANESGTLSTQWTWIQDTAHASTYFKQYVGSSTYMLSPTANQGVFYFDGITNLVNSTYGYENSKLTNSTPINTLGHNAVSLKFYQLYKAYNHDTTLIEVSNDNVTWYKVLANPDITANGNANKYAYGIKEFNITPWAGNKAQVWIRFRFIAPATTSSGAQYSGGYGWMIDDVSIEDAPSNRIEFSELWGGFAAQSPAMWSGYTKFPSGQSYPVTMQASFTNTGGATQKNVKLIIKDLTNSKTGTSANIDSLPIIITDTTYVDIDTLSTIGTYKYAIKVVSDSISQIPYKDTLSLVVNNYYQGLYSRDNNYYNGYRRWNGVNGSSVNAYQFANLVEVNAEYPGFWAKSIGVIIGEGTTINAPIKAILYRGWGQSKTVVAETDYHFIQANEIVHTIGDNPHEINLYFNNYTNCKLQKDSVYFVALQAFGGSDSVWLAVGSSTIPQPDYSMYIFDTDNTWYYYPKGTAPAMIRFYTGPPSNINEYNLTNAILYQNMPNPATNTTRISYELKKTETVNIDIYDFLGNKIKTFNEGRVAAGYHSIEINLNAFASGTYFYSLKTDKSTITKKMVVIK